MPAAKSRYSSPSVVVTQQPWPLATCSGVTENHTFDRCEADMVGSYARERTHGWGRRRGSTRTLGGTGERGSHRTRRAGGAQQSAGQWWGAPCLRAHRRLLLAADRHRDRRPRRAVAAAAGPRRVHPGRRRAVPRPRADAGRRVAAPPRFRPGLAALTSVLGFFLVVGALIAVTVPSFADELDSIGPDAHAGGRRRRGLGGRGQADRHLARELRPLPRAHGASGCRHSPTSPATRSRIVRPSSRKRSPRAVLSVILTFFMVRDGAKFAAWVRSKAPSHRRAGIHRGMDAAWTTLAGYLRGATAARRARVGRDRPGDAPVAAPRSSRR